MYVGFRVLGFSGSGVVQGSGFEVSRSQGLGV